ncbi:hypothetical protein Tsubulata_027338 [Turnera subulata]|uniref:RRM domain-containing protein n=1 Tax=Turnera subulata TaxID=218843 RepID=A0A9Q0JF70_9ROSI|nr:hypothetical protein Tsubulata_027338 [Turnera subulata]
MDNSQVVSLYVENLPSLWTPANIHRVLSKYGEVVDVFVPVKSTRSGKRFGFVRYQKAGDLQRLLTAVNNVQVENGTLQANIAKERHQPKSVVGPPQGLRAERQQTHPLRFHKSFAAVTSGDQGATPISRSFIPPPPGIIFQPTPETLEWLSTCAYGVLKSPMNYLSVQQQFVEHGLVHAKVSQLGGDSVLVCFPSSEYMQSFCRDPPFWIRDSFWVFKPWQRGNHATSRNCWVKVRGIPPHAWSTEFFRLAAVFVGRLIEVAPETVQRQRLDFASLLIQTTLPTMIDKTIDVTIEGQVFHVSMTESSSIYDHVFLSSSPGRCPSGNMGTEGPAAAGGVVTVENFDAVDKKGQTFTFVAPVVSSQTPKSKDDQDDNSSDSTKTSVHSEPLMTNVIAAEHHGSPPPSEPIRLSNSFAVLAPLVATDKGDQPIHSPTQTRVPNTPPYRGPYAPSYKGPFSSAGSFHSPSSVSSAATPSATNVNMDVQRRLALAMRTRCINKRRVVKVLVSRGNTSSATWSDIGPRRFTYPHESSAETPPPLNSPFFDEATRTLQVGDVLGWDNSENPQTVATKATELVEKESHNWSLTRLDV